MTKAASMTSRFGGRFFLFANMNSDLGYNFIITQVNISVFRGLFWKAWIS